MKSEKIKMITFVGMFAALIFLTTFALHIPTGLNGGYVHLGDAMIYLAASMLPTPFAIIAASVGAGLSDIMTPGAAIWAPATIIIKSLCCLPFTNKGEKLLCKRNVLGTVFAGLITIFGYGVASAILTKSIAIAILEIPFSLVQSTSGAICFIVISAALQRANVKNMLSLKK